jgi:murein L,D-transpeptidase YafK
MNSSRFTDRAAPRIAGRIVVLALLGGMLSACQESRTTGGARASAPIPSNVLALMKEKNTDAHKPILIRAFKKEAEFEIWKQQADGQYTLLKTYPMCRWSGQLGPKIKEGDRQVPEGFYTITPGQMNPNSAYYLSFNVGYPNAYDRAHGYSGGSIMVHGACSSAGCFSMTDEQIAEIYAIAREAFGGGQRAIQLQSLPFRMNADNLAKHRFDPNMKFWKDLKEGSDQFEVSKQETRVSICARRYVFGAAPADGRPVRDGLAACPPMETDQQLAALVSQKQKQDEAKVAELVASGVKPVRLVYADGGQHPEFAMKINELSRPEALEQGPREIVIDDKGRPVTPVAVQLAAAKSTRSEPKSQPASIQSARQTDGVTSVPASTPASAAEAQGFFNQILGFSDPTPAAAPMAPASFAASPGPSPVAEQQPFYKRLLWSSEPVAAPQPEPSARPIPLPPRRQAIMPGAAAPKPQASLAPPTSFKAVASLER